MQKGGRGSLQVELWKSVIAKTTALKIIREDIQKERKGILHLGLLQMLPLGRARGSAEPGAGQSQGQGRARGRVEPGSGSWLLAPSPAVCQVLP